MKVCIKVFLVLCLVSTIPFNGIAKRKKYIYYSKPEVILFMLRKSENEIEGMRKRGMNDDIKRLIEEDSVLNSNMIASVSRNVTYCPVYFFYVEDLDAVKAKKWDQIIFFDGKGINSEINANIKKISDFLMVDYNYPPSDYEAAVFVGGRDKGLFFYDENYKILNIKIKYRTKFFSYYPIRLRFLLDDEDLPVNWARSLQYALEKITKKRIKNSDM
jgi:hypothetical protein